MCDADVKYVKYFLICWVLFCHERETLLEEGQRYAPSVDC